MIFASFLPIPPTCYLVSIDIRVKVQKRSLLHIGRATRFVVSGFPTLLILGPPLLILGPPLLILGPTLLILEPTWLILVVKMGIAIRKKTQTIQTVDSGFE